MRRGKLAHLRGMEVLNFLVVTRKFCVDWFKVAFLGEAGTVVRLGIKFWFADMGPLT